MYSCSVKILEGNVNSHNDQSADVLNDEWNPKNALAKLKAAADQQICDALLDQDIFAGVDNGTKYSIGCALTMNKQLGKYLRQKLKRLSKRLGIIVLSFWNGRKIMN